jgi:NADH:ubiquinone oxidoreductase subunit 6 (subunit J)
VRDFAFYALAVILLASAAAAVTARSLFRAAFALAAALLATAGFYLLLSAPLLAAVQILLYTGGVLTLIVFALVVTGAPAGGAALRRPLPAALLAVAVLAALVSGLREFGSGEARGGLDSGAAVGTLLFTDYLVPFELLSVLLLGAVFGALLLARKDRLE